MTDRRLKPCATCHHGKTKHRVGYCIHQWVTRGQTFMGVSAVVKYCQCDGYTEPTPSTTEPQEAPRDH